MPRRDRRGLHRAAEQPHCDYAVRAAQAGVHALVEKPMASTEEECSRMALAAREAGVKLMGAYRLHFERANPEAIEVARSGRIGAPRLFTSSFNYDNPDPSEVETP